jgi:succinate dehydrogenase / fumarate reductase flavoprotein subunit
VKYSVREFDSVVIGAGGAGMRAALAMHNFYLIL